jgi:outer membrane lipase/esterase
MSRYLTGAAAGALALAACAFSGAASAQDYGRLVVFGDSLSDNGNLSAATMGTQPPAPYYQGRFSSGPVFTELLGFNLGRFAAGAPVSGSIDLAFGGAVSGTAALPLGITSQLNAYLASGGTFGPNDLVSVLGGANDIFQALPVAGATTNPVAAITPTSATAAANINAVVDTIAARGAGTVVVTGLPSLAVTPQFRGTPAAALADYAATTLNSQLLTRLTATAAARPNTNIVYVDLYKAGQAVVANPQAFGFSNITAPCFNQTAMTVCSDPSGYLYFDGVHPTARGHQFMAAVVEDYIYYADAGSGTTLQGETAFRHREDSLDEATASLAMRGPWVAGTAISVSGSVDDTQTDARGPVGEAQSDGYGARISAEHSPNDSWRFGVAGGFRQADVEAGAHSFELQSIGLDVYAGWRSEAMFLNLAAGAASDDYEDIRRQTALAPIVHSGSTRGNSYGARAQAGLWFDMGGIALSPRVAAGWISSNVDGYFEQGYAAQYAYDDRTVEAITAEATLRAEADMGGFGVFAEGGYRDNLDDNSDPVRVGIAGNPAQVIAAYVDEPFGGQVLARAGVHGDWGPVRIAAGYTGRFGDHADSHMGGIKLTLQLP